MGWCRVGEFKCDRSSLFAVEPLNNDNNNSYAIIIVLPYPPARELVSPTFSFPSIYFLSLPRRLSPRLPPSQTQTKMPWLAGYGKLDDEENDNLGVDWVLQYEFGDIGKRLHLTSWVAGIDDRQIKLSPSRSSARSFTIYTRLVFGCRCATDMVRHYWCVFGFRGIILVRWCTSPGEI